MQQLNLYCSTVLRSEWGQGYILFCWSTFPRSAVNRSGACLCDRLRPHELVCSHTSQTCSSPIRRLGHVLPWPDWKQTPSHHLGAWFIGVTAVMSGFRLLPVYAVLWERTWGLRRCRKEAAACATTTLNNETIQQRYKNYEICSANRSSTSKLWQQLQSCRKQVRTSAWRSRKI